MNYERAKTYLEEHGQSQLLQYYDELSESERRQLLAEIEYTNFNIIKNIKGNSAKKQGKISPAANTVSVQEAARRRIQFEAVGLNMLTEGKVGSVLLAGVRARVWATTDRRARSISALSVRLRFSNS